MNINLGPKFIFSFYKGKIFCRKKTQAAQGFTLVELMTVLVILTVSIGMFYSVWFSNWMSFDQHTAIADLWFDANKISEAMGMDGRAASLITVALDQKSVDFENSLGVIVASYQMTPAGDFIITRGAANTTVSRSIDYANSFFVQQGRSLEANLTLADNEVLGQDVSINSRMEVFPRN